MPGTGTGSNIGDSTSGYLGAFHDKKILEVYENNAVFSQLAEKHPIAMRSGAIITFHTETALGLGERISGNAQPTGQYMTGSTKTATLIQFGDVTSIGDLMAKVAINSLTERALLRFGTAAALTLDTYIQDKLFSEVTEDYSAAVAYHEGPAASRTGKNHRPISTWYKAKQGGLSAIFLSANLTIEGVGTFSGFLSTAGAAAVDSYLTIRKIKRMAYLMESNNIPRIDGAAYVMVCNPAVVDKLMDDPEWTTWQIAQNATKMYNNEIGQIYGVRIIKSTNALKFNNAVYLAATCYLNTILGGQTFAMTELAGETGISFYTVPFDNVNHANVLQQTAMVGWKWTGAVKVLNPNCGYGVFTFIN